MNEALWNGENPSTSWTQTLKDAGYISGFGQTEAQKQQQVRAAYEAWAAANRQRAVCDI